MTEGSGSGPHGIRHPSENSSYAVAAVSIAFAVRHRSKIMSPLAFEADRRPPSRTARRIRAPFVAVRRIPFEFISVDGVPVKESHNLMMPCARIEPFVGVLGACR